MIIMNTTTDGSWTLILKMNFKSDIVLKSKEKVKVKYIIVQIAMHEENLYLYPKVAFIWSLSPEILPINALIFTWADDDLRFCDKLNWIQTLKVHTDQNHWTKTTD